MTEPDPLIGRVIGTSRRFVTFLLGDDSTPKTGTAASKAIDATLGDLVRVEKRGSEWVIQSVHPAKHRLARSYRGELRPIAHNLDHLFIVTAIPPLFNTHAIDRVLAVAHEQEIPTSIILNKVDLAPESAAALLAPYTSIGLTVLTMSAKFGNGVEPLLHELSGPELHIVAFTGVSGAGKSTILNCLIPGLKQRTAEVSRKTGQGKQTTSHPVAHVFPRTGLEPLLLVDLPGIQNFGVAHLSRESIAESFPEFRAGKRRCPFDNCSHIYEEECEVRARVERGDVSASRYLSYLSMVEEVETAPKY